MPTTTYTIDAMRIDGMKKLQTTNPQVAEEMSEKGHRVTAITESDDA